MIWIGTINDYRSPAYRLTQLFHHESQKPKVGCRMNVIDLLTPDLADLQWKVVAVPKESQETQPAFLRECHWSRRVLLIQSE